MNFQVNLCQCSIADKCSFALENFKQMSSSTNYAEKVKQAFIAHEYNPFLEFLNGTQFFL